MNAIILSREDADWILQTSIQYADFLQKNESLLENGTPSYSWLQLVPDEVLHVIQGGDCSDDIFQRVSKEIYRRKNLKSTKD